MIKTLSDQGDWDKLINLISDGKLTPVVGKEMYKFTDNSGLSPIDDYLSKKLLEKFTITGQPPVNLTDAVNYIETEKNEDYDDISGEIIACLNETLKSLNFEFPLLTDLLKISQLKYFINTTVYNNILEGKIREARKQEAVSINFSINEPFPDSPDLTKLIEPFIFNVFGSLQKTSDPAISEEDMLEYTSYFKEKMSNAANLVNALQNKSLLFIGCAYPGWMTRFVLRLLTIQPMHEWGTGKPSRKIYVVNDKSAFREEQYKILKNYNVITYEGGTNEFMDELLQQWKKVSSKFEKPKTIFLSYTRADTAAVENLKKGLEKIENINCWYDKRSLEPGDNWVEEIAANIRDSDLFIPLISENSIEHEDGYVQKEWLLGKNAWVLRKHDQINEKYLVPVVIDDSKLYGASISKHFDSSINIIKIPQGNPDEEFINDIKKILNLV